MHLIITTGFACFGFGVIAGAFLDYYIEGRYLRKRNQELVTHILKMRRQGFVPQFDIEQVSSFDPSEHIREF